MGKTGVTIEWSIVEDEREWSARQTAPTVDERTKVGSASRAASRTETRVALVAIALFLFLIGGSLWQRQAQAEKTMSELQAALVQELQAQAASARLTRSETVTRSGNETLISRTSAPSRASTPPVASTEIAPTTHVSEFQRLGNRVMAQVTASYPEEGVMFVYRETRFYQKAEAGWQRIEPDPDLMGPSHTFKTAHFTLYYRSMDAGIVYETAPKLEELYTKLRGDFGLPVADATTSYSLEVVTDRLVNGYSFSSGKRTIAIPSPTLLSVPVEMTATTALYQSMVYPLAHLVVNEVIEQYQMQWKQSSMLWRYMDSALRLWVWWEEDGPLADGRAEIVRWHFERIQTQGVKARQPLPDGYARFCRTYRIWRMSPLDHYIPLVCNDEDKQLLSVPDYPTLSSWREERLNQGIVALVDAPDSTVATETIIEYVVATYGLEQLPLLIKALGQHTNINTLIRAVFGISAAEFEAGWQAYLAEQYGVK